MNVLRFVRKYRKQKTCLYINFCKLQGATEAHPPDMVEKAIFHIQVHVRKTILAVFWNTTVEQKQ